MWQNMPECCWISAKFDQIFSGFSQKFNAAILGKSQNCTFSFRFGNAHIYFSCWKTFNFHFHEHSIFHLIFTELSGPSLPDLDGPWGFRPPAGFSSITLEPWREGIRTFRERLTSWRYQQGKRYINERKKRRKREWFILPLLPPPSFFLFLWYE